MLTADHTDERTSRRVTAWVAVLAVALFGLGILLVRPYGLSYDEAKYLGMGANLWAGNGPVTAFGYLFLQHGPLWMGVVYAPQALFGIDAIAWGHLLDALAGAGIVGVAAMMGRRSSPAAGIVAAFAMLGFTYLFNLSRTTRLDVPVAFLGLLYLEVGWRAARGGSIRWAVAAGAAFAAAVLVKEVPIPLAPVPFLCGLLAGFGWARLLRTAGWTTLAATVGLAPWFVYYAAQTGTVYRVGSPAWTLPVLFAPVAGLIVVGLLADRLARSGPVLRGTGRASSAMPAWLGAHGRGLAGWGLAIAWSLLFLFFFSRIGRLHGIPMFQLAQYRLYLHTWAFELVPILLFSGVGTVLAVPLLLARAGRGRLGLVNAVVATVCGLPLVLMVIAVGEPPRNYIAQLATAVVVGSIGWTWAADRLVARLTRSGRRPQLARYGLAVVVAVVMAAGTMAFGARAWVTRAAGSGASSEATSTAVAWIRANVPAGTPVAFGAYLSYEMADELVPAYPTYQVQAKLSSADPSMPLGLTYGSEAPAADWVAADVAPRNVNQYEAYRAQWIQDELRAHHIGYWVYATGVSTAAPSIVAQLTPEHGFTQVASWSFGPAKSPVRVSVFRVDLANISLDTSHLYMSPDAFDRLVAKLEATPPQSKAAAAALVQRVVVEPASAAGDAAMARLRALAAP